MLALIMIHIFCVITMWFLEKNKGDFHIGRLLMVALVPIFGLLCVISMEWVRRNLHGKGEELHLNEPVLEDDIYRSIHIRPEKDAEGILPLEESLLINDPAKRRSLILNILNLDPSDFVTGLRKAGVNDDTEVVHYATTAMAEMSKQHAIRLQRYENAFAAAPDDAAGKATEAADAKTEKAAAWAEARRPRRACTTNSSSRR